MKKIRVAHLGIAHDHSSVTMETVREYPELYEVIGVCEPDDETREKFGSHEAYRGLPWLAEEELLNREDIDAVLCEGNELRSVSDAQKCIDHNKHVHLDKPGGINLCAFEKLLLSAEEKGLTVQMGYMFRYNPAMRRVLDAVKSGKLGDIISIDGSFSVAHTAEKRKWLKQFPGGMMCFLGCHIIDMIMMINGTPERVIPFNHSTDWDNDGSIDSGFAVLDYPKGACFVRANGTEVNGVAGRYLRVCGTLGTMDIRPLEFPTLMTETFLNETEGKKFSNKSRDVFLGYMPGRYGDMMKEFAACVRGDIKNPYSPQYELEVQRVLLEACK